MNKVSQLASTVLLSLFSFGAAKAQYKTDYGPMVRVKDYGLWDEHKMPDGAIMFTPHNDTFKNASKIAHMEYYHHVAWAPPPHDMYLTDSTRGTFLTNDYKGTAKIGKNNDSLVVNIDRGTKENPDVQTYYIDVKRMRESLGIKEKTDIEARYGLARLENGSVVAVVAIMKGHDPLGAYVIEGAKNITAATTELTYRQR